MSTRGGEELDVVVDSHQGEETAVSTISFHFVSQMRKWEADLRCRDPQVRSFQQHGLEAIKVQTWKE